MKNFDGWNNEKKKIDELDRGRSYFPGEIWWCSLGLNVGSEQDGDKYEFQRPVLIIKWLGRKTCLIAPLTTSPREHIYKIDIGQVNGRNAKVIFSQIKVIDTKRLSKKIVALDRSLFETIKKSLKEFL